MQNKFKLTYEELEKDIELEIFGLNYNICVNRDYLQKIEEISNINTNDNEQVIKTAVCFLLGNNAYQEIKDKYKKDQGKEIDEFVWVKVVLFVRNQIVDFFNYGKKYETNINSKNKRYNGYRDGYRGRRSRRY